MDVTDLLKVTFNKLEEEPDHLLIDLNIDFLSKDTSTLAQSYMDLHEILSSDNSTYVNRTSAIQQLTFGICDHSGQFGRKLFREIAPRKSTFTICIEQIISAYHLTLQVGDVNQIDSHHQMFLNEVLRFTILSILMH
jgi:hypothetical protein